MKDKRHKRKETYSLILVSHIDNRSRHIKFSARLLYFLEGLLCLLCIAIGVTVFYCSIRGFREYELQQQVDSQIEQISILESENMALTQERQSLEDEVEALLRAAQEEEAEPEAQKDVVSTFPRFYPSDGVGVLQTSFSDEHPYLTITIPRGDNVVATGDGVVSAVDYHDDYLHSVEIEHESGYISRYLCNKDVTIEVEAGKEVQAGEPLFTINSDETQLDYQIILGGEAVNPFSVMKLEG